MKRWRADAPSVLGEVLGRVFADPSALAEGRVFVNRTRVQDARIALHVGAMVEVGEASATSSGALELLHDDPAFVVVDKPAGLVSVPDHHGHDSLQARVAAYCKLPIERVHPTSRLDRGVSGVVIFALAKAAREALAQAREDGTYHRTYLALAARAPEPDAGTWSWPIGRDPKDARKRKVNGKDPAPARTDYRVLARAPYGALLALSPHTGRTHQLRVHCAHAGSPLDGDAAYGGRARVSSDQGDLVTLGRVALHAARVEVPWPTPQVFAAPWPEALAAWWLTLGGTSDPPPLSP